MEKTVKIYTLSDPRNNEIRYVGKTTSSLIKRLNGHTYSANKYNFHNARWIKTLLTNSLKPNINLLEECLESDWVEREKYWIKYYKDLGIKLNNNTDGGDGHSGYKKSEELKKRISDWSKGKSISLEQREKISIANKGKKHSLEFKNQISERFSKSCYLYNSITKELLTFPNLKGVKEYFNLKGRSIGYKLENDNYLKPYKKIYYLLNNKEDINKINK